MKRSDNLLALLGCLCASVCTILLLNACAVNGDVLAGDRYTVKIGERQITPPVMTDEKIVEYLQKSPLEHDQVILQLDNIPTLRERRELHDLGIKLLTPLPGTAWLASVPADLSAAQLKRVPVRWMGRLEANDKLAPALRERRAGPHALREPGRIELLVKLFAGANVEQITVDFERLGAEVRRDASEKLGVMIISIPEKQLDLVANVGGLRYIEPTLPPGQAEADRARAFIGSDPVAAAGTNGNGSTVGVFEYEHAYTGHPAFGGRVTKGDADPTFYYKYGHATLTAGLIAGDGSLSNTIPGAGALQYRGIAPGTTVRTYAYTDVDSIINYMGDVQDAVQNDNVDIGNNSWGDAGCATFAYGTYAGRAPFLDDVVRGSFGRPVPIVFSAGNERRGQWDANIQGYTYDCVANDTGPFANYETLNHPKSAKNILVVGAVDSANDRMTSYSSWGPTQDGRVKPEVVAAGHHDGTNLAGVTDMTVVDHLYWVAGRGPIGDLDQFRYLRHAQTSAASAAVSGVYALILEAWRDKYPGRVDPLPSSYKALVVHSARDLNDATAWYNRGPDFASGYGVVDAAAAIDAINDGILLESDVSNGEAATYYLAVAAATPSLKVSMAWDDPAAADNANPTLRNDLDLVVTDPNGARHYPWTLDPANPATPAVRIQADHINNLEQVVVDNPVPGTWEISVVGTSVPEGPQYFSVLADNGPIRQPVDLILALDISSSMNSSPPGGGAVPSKIALLKQAVELFLQTWSLHAVAGDRIGVVYFSSNLSSLPGAPPVLIDLNANLGTVITNVNNISASGCTAMGAALQEAFDSFPPAGNNKRTVVLFSDGKQSINPYVGEEDMPLRLKIKSYASDANLPFGAFRCSTGTALALSGNPSTPDGQFVDEQGVEIHTIGVGVSGAGFEQVIERIANETDGLHHFTSQPDADLDLFYTQDLVQSLKSNTLELIRTDSGSLASGALESIDFDVNNTVKNLTLVLSWKGILQNDAISIAVKRPNGNNASGAAIRQGPHYKVIRIDRRQYPNSFAGSWRVELRNTAAVTLGYQQSLIADEDQCFGYELTQASGVHSAGGKIHVSAKLTEYGRPLIDSKAVSLNVSAPAISSANLLAKWLPQVRPALKPRPDTTTALAERLPVTQMAELESRVAALATEPRFIKELRRRETSTIALVDNGDKTKGDWVAGDGIYSAFIENTAIAGDYMLTYGINTDSACGPITRSQRSGMLVRPGRFDLGPSNFEFERVAGGIVLAFRPADRFGNLLGPGYAHEVTIRATGAELQGNLIDRLDGSYAQQIVFRQGQDPKISLTVGPRATRPVFEAPLSYLMSRWSAEGGLPVQRLVAPRVKRSEANE